MHPRPLGPLIVALASLLLAPSAASQYVFALNSQGKVYVNATLVDDAKGGVSLNDLDEDDLDDLDQIWNALAVDGPDWFLLRFDGRLEQNGEQIDDFSDDGPLQDSWWDMTRHMGQTWALRGDGRVNVEGTVVAEFEDSDFYFARIFSDGSDVWTLRTDGRCFKNTASPALFRFNAPDGVTDGDDGEATDTVWLDLASDPGDGALFGLRRDGRVGRADPSKLTGDGGPPSVPNIATLPFPDDAENVDLGKYYVDLEFLSDGRWIVLRGNGEIYADDGLDAFELLVDLPGDAEDLDDNLYVDLLPLADGSFASLRQDGRIYVDTDLTEVIDLPGQSFREAAITDEFPVLDNAKPAQPTVAKYTIKGIVGEAFTVPVLIADPDTPDEDLVVTVDEETIPPGAVWDEETRTLTWDDPGPKGGYKFAFEVAGGADKPVKQTYSIKLKDPDDDELKNRKPTSAKIKKVTAMDGIELAVPILAFDADGDALTITPEDEAVYPYTAGATFDTETDTFHWTPQVADVGKVKLVFLVDDGTKTVKRKVQVKVIATLLTFP